jgi:hypothetical protein
MNVIANMLRHLLPGHYVHFKIREATQPQEPLYHGTSWMALKSILANGFLGSFGEGRVEMYKRFGEDRTVVYLSPLWENALRYPMAMQDVNKQFCGEVVASDVPPIRTMLICGADVSRRRWKKRAGTNQQDAYLPEGLTVTAVVFQGMSTAPAEHPSSHASSSGAAQPAPLRAPVQGRAIAAVMAIRILTDDDRRSEILREAVLDLVDLFVIYTHRHDLPEDEPLSNAHMQQFWNNDLRQEYLQDEEHAFAGREAHEIRTLGAFVRKQQVHRRFSAWIRQRFGDKNHVRYLMQNGLDERIVRFLRHEDNSHML